MTSEQAERDPPDLATVVPGILTDLGRQGFLVNLETFLDVGRLRQIQSPHLVSLGTVAPDGTWPSDHGHLFGAFTKLDVKGLVWYPKPELESAGYEIPSTWEDLDALSRGLLATGKTPWCMGLESGEASGWPATDWIENLVLAESGVETYDAWTFHRLPFDSPPIRRAFERFGDVVFPDGSVLGGPEEASRRPFFEAQLPMLDPDPGCWLYPQATFASIFLPPGSAGTTTDTFPFPAMAGEEGGVIGGGEMMGAFSDRPEVREALEFFFSPRHGIEAAERGLDYLSPHRDFDSAHYTPFMRRQAEVLKDALANDTFRFDASDLMPTPVGDHVFFNAMLQYLREGPDSLDEILPEVDAAWPDTG
jgi:alpha-glucoside transport system substrate-binding protein